MRPSSYYCSKTYICESCFHTQQKYRKSKCPECRSNMFICDEWIAPTIQLLNKKGHITDFSCSGHYDFTDESSFFGTYVKFRKQCPPNLPECFFVSKSFGNMDTIYLGKKDPNVGCGGVMTALGTCKTHQEKLMFFAESLGELHKWAEGLPDLSKNV